MKIAVTASEASLEARIDPRFGRCACFLVVDTETMDFEAIENPNIALGGGAGIQSAQLMSQKGVKHVLTGNCGPNAHQTLSTAGISVIVGCSGTVKDAVEQFKAGQATPASEPNVAGHFGVGGPPSPSQGQPAPSQQEPMTGGGMGGGMGAGMGGGMGRGMGGGMGGGRGGGRGRGMGRGMGGGRGGGMGQGRGMGMGAGFPDPGAAGAPQPPPVAGKEEELSLLKQQAEAMAEQMKQIQERIEQLGKEEQ